MEPREIASRAYWEAEGLRAYMSPLMWELERSHGQVLAELRYQAEECQRLASLSGCFLTLAFTGRAKELQTAYAEKLWTFAFIDAHSHPLRFLCGLAWQRYDSAWHLGKDDPKRQALHDMWRLLKTRSA